MRKFMITSEKFEGTAFLFYNTQEVLCRIDCTDTTMDAELIKAFKRAVPATLEELVKGEGFSKGTLVVEAGYRIDFEKFWTAYDKKINKQRCIPLYNRLTDAETIECLHAIKPYDRFLEKVKVRQKLDPENWIKQKAFQTEWNKL